MNAIHTIKGKGQTATVPKHHAKDKDIKFHPLTSIPDGGVVNFML